SNQQVFQTITETRPTPDETVSRVFDGAGTLQSTTVETSYGEYGRDVETSYPNGSSVRNTYDGNGTLISTNGTAAPLQALGSAITDLNALVQAIRSGQPLPILNSGLNLLNDATNPVVNGTQVLNNQP